MNDGIGTLSPGMQIFLFIMCLVIGVVIWTVLLDKLGWESTYKKVL